MRLLAHHIIVDGVDHGFAVAEISANRKEITVTPFSREIHSTSFISGTLVITKSEGIYHIYSEYLGKYL